jgi:hypothetical protein
MGRVDGDAPGLDLKPALTQALHEMSAKGDTRDLAPACDRQFEIRGADLRNLH